MDPPRYKEIIDHLAGKAEEYKDKALLSLTHGQPATPTRSARNSPYTCTV